MYAIYTLYNVYSYFHFKIFKQQLTNIHKFQLTKHCKFHTYNKHPAYFYNILANIILL